MMLFMEPFAASKAKQYLLGEVDDFRLTRIAQQSITVRMLSD